MGNEIKTENFSVKSFFEKINLIFHGILAIPLAIFGWLYLEAQNGSQLTVEDVNMDVLNFIMPFFILGTIGASIFLFRNRLKLIDSKLLLPEKLDKYLLSSLIKFAGLELALILSVVGYYLSYSNTFVAMFVIVLVFFSLSKPTTYRVADALRLEGEERDLVINKANEKEIN